MLKYPNMRIEFFDNVEAMISSPSHDKLDTIDENAYQSIFLSLDISFKFICDDMDMSTDANRCIGIFLLDAVEAQSATSLAQLFLSFAKVEPSSFKQFSKSQAWLDTVAAAKAMQKLLIQNGVQQP